MSDATLSLDQLSQAIVQHLQQHLPGVQAVAAWPPIQDDWRLPAVLVELAQIEPGADIGTGETPLACTFEARVIVDPQPLNHAQQAVHIATRLIVLLRAQSWGLPVENAGFIQAAQDTSRAELEGYTVWRVTWRQTLYLGSEEWPWPDQPAGNLVFGFYPDTGAGHAVDYIAPEDV